MTAAAAQTDDQVIELAVDEIHDSSIPNYRLHYDGVQEMADSMKKVGVLQKPIVRPRKHKDGGFELVFGYKRRAAAKLAGLATLRCELRQLTDEEVYAARLVENLQRSNPHPMDEARCLQDMIANRSYTVERIADETGKPTRYIRERLQLCQLSAKCQKALDADEITLGVALVLARIPQAKLQDEALDDCAADGDNACVSVARAVELVRDDFMLKLTDAPFDRADPDLLKKAGACTVCPKRTGNQTELFADVKNHDLCTDPACFREKGTAYLKQVVAGDKGKRKLKVLNAEGAKKTFGGYGSGINYTSDLEDLNAESTFYVGSHTKRLKNKTLVGPDVEVTLGQDPKTGKVYELVSKKAVSAALTKAKNEATKEARKKKPGSAKKKADPKEAAKRKADAEKAQAKEQINEALVDALVANAESSALASVAAAPFRILVKRLIEDSATEKLLARRQIGTDATKGESGAKKPLTSGGWKSRQAGDRALDKLVDQAGPDWLWGVAFELLAWDALEADYGPKTGNVDPLLKAFGVDRKKVEAQVVKALALAKKVAAEQEPAPKKKAAAKKATATKTAKKRKARKS
jgi:ParB/RepB/Spo0J family partition protein